MLLVASQVLDGLPRWGLLLFLGGTYLTWGIGLWANLEANWALLEATGTSTNALSKAAHDLTAGRTPSRRLRKVASAVGYVSTELAKEIPYYAGAFGAALLTDAVSADDALIFLGGANLGAALYEYGLCPADARVPGHPSPTDRRGATCRDRPDRHALGPVARVDPDGDEPTGGLRYHHAPEPDRTRRRPSPVKIQEADAKSLLVAQGLPVPPWEVAHTVDEARAAAERFLAEGPVGGKVVIKAQVLVGGRGKAGGVKLAGSVDEAGAGRRGHPRHGHQGHDRPQGPDRPGGGHRQGVLPRRGARPGRARGSC